MLDNFLVTPPAQVLTYPSLTFAGTGLILSLLTIMYHVIPAIVFDAYFRATNNKIRYDKSFAKKLLRRVDKSIRTFTDSYRCIESMSTSWVELPISLVASGTSVTKI